MAMPAQTSDLTDWKRYHERTTFEQFCTATGIAIVPGSIDQPDPPAPDLIANLLGIGRVAFELVRLNADEQLMRMNLMHKAPGFFEEQFATLPSDLQSQIKSMYIDGIITIGFKPGVGLGARKNAMPAVWDILVTLPPAFKGQVDLWDRTALRDVSSIWVTRGKTGGRPWFKSYATGYVLPLAADRIAEKLQKRYQCAEPLELLAYVDQGELAHLNAPDEIAAVVSLHLPESQFRQVWVYEGLQRRVALRYSNVD
jgi:hypothetical protein